MSQIGYKQHTKLYCVLPHGVKERDTQHTKLYSDLPYSVKERNTQQVKKDREREREGCHRQRIKCMQRHILTFLTVSKRGIHSKKRKTERERGVSQTAHKMHAKAYSDLPQGVKERDTKL